MGEKQYPIVEKWNEIMDWLMTTVEKFPKNTRFSLSSRMLNIALDVAEKLVEAIYTKSRVHILVQVNVYIEKLRMLNRVCIRRNLLSIKQYEHISSELQIFGNMLGGWIKSEMKQK